MALSKLNSLLLLAASGLVVRAQNSTTPTTTTAGSSPSGSACASQIPPKYAAPSIASGWRADIVATGLSDPRALLFDSEGALLVVEQFKGISRLQLEGDGACVRAQKAERFIQDETLNHGIELSEDGKTLYASSSNTVFSWSYDASSGKNTSDPRALITNMDNEDHFSRTLLLSKKVPGLLLVSRGSQSNLDLDTLDVSRGISTIKAFNLTNLTADSAAYNQPDSGLLLGWGLRNSVGVAEEPITGGIYSVENSVDNFNRSGVNIHQNNPGEEMNFHGYLNGTAHKNFGANYGYPTCFAAWKVDEIPDNEGLQTGMQITISDQNVTRNDTVCREERIPPVLTFQAHQAPLDIKFNANGTAAWVTFHGSWNRDDPTGYKLSTIAFDGAGSPTEPPNSTTAAIDILSNPDLAKCPDACIRPVGLTWDTQGRLFMSSDYTGEIWVITREDGGSAEDQSPSQSAGASRTPSGPGTQPSETGEGQPGGVGRVETRGGWAVVGGVIAALLV